MQKIVFITGATSGFGKASAEKFASHGYDCILNGRREERLLELKKTLEKQYNIAVYLLPFDVKDEAKEIERQKAEMEKQNMNYLLVGNKIDSKEEAREKFSLLDKVIFISAKHNLHTEVLKERMTDTVLKGRTQTEDTVVTNARHYHALNEVQKSLSDIQSGLTNKLSGDLLALDIRRCLHYLGEITGEISNEDMLDYIFSKFCIGK